MANTMSANDIIGNATSFASDIRRIAPNGLPTWEGQFLEDELAAAMENNSKGLLAGFQFPANLGEFDFQNIVSFMEEFGSNVGYKYLPTPGQVMDAYNKGITNFADAAKLWGDKLPKSLGYVKHGMTSAQFSQYKEQNKQQIIERYGAHADAKAENFVDNLDNPMPSFSSHAEAFGQTSGAPATAAVGPSSKTTVR